MTMSMTGFASATGGTPGWNWSWELRGVNARGLDLRLRVPDWISGLEPALRARLQAAFSRGSVTLSLRLTREGAAEGVDAASIERALLQLKAVEQIAARQGRQLAALTAADVLALRGQSEPLADEAMSVLADSLLAQFDAGILPAFLETRATEGRALDPILMQRLDEIADLVSRAQEAATARQESQGDHLRAAIDRVTAEVTIDEGRLAQELALLAVKQDITEELDRLRAHVDTAKALVRGQGPKGRKLDFLMQEFNREANTLCSKSQDASLTVVGLDLKSVIDQLREQVQNVE
ncbi:YicC/YloC family endoribonuclease [Palleronia sp.]|uniref:YicC/YloC family endoribonuclease n=1 Tax=Palleronia sp. TaxID=1940284 RepID=UPI0035C7EDDD